MRNEAVANARLALLYHSLWDKPVADETFARWSREDFVTLAAVAEAIYAYDQSPNPHAGGVERVVGVSRVLHEWMAVQENFKREHADWAYRGRPGAEPRNPLAQQTATNAAATGAPIYEYRRLAGAMVRDGKFAQVVAPGTQWISFTSPDDLHRVLQVDANRREGISERTRARQLAAGVREEAATAAADAAIDWAPIENQIAHNVANRPTSGASI